VVVGVLAVLAIVVGLLGPAAWAKVTGTGAGATSAKDRIAADPPPALFPTTEVTATATQVTAQHKQAVRATQHYAVADFGTLRREVRRVTVAGDVPRSIEGRSSVVREGSAEAFSTIDDLSADRPHSSGHPERLVRPSVALLAGDDRDGEPEVLQAVREVLVESGGHSVLGHGEHDLVDRLAVERLLDRVHGVVPHRHRPDHAPTGGLLEERVDPVQHFFGLDGPVMSLGVQRMELCASRVEHHDSELHVAGE